MKGRPLNWYCTFAVPIRLYLGVVFIWASLYKVVEPSQFALSIATYGILPLKLVNPMAILLPWVEAVVGITLMVGFWTRGSALAISGMMLMFIVAISIALSKDLHLSCGCFASADAEEEITQLTLIRDLAWMMGALYVLLVDDGRFGIDGWLRRRRQAVAPSSRS